MTITPESVAEGQAHKSGRFVDIFNARRSLLTLLSCFRLSSPMTCRVLGLAIAPVQYTLHFTATYCKSYK